MTNESKGGKQVTNAFNKKLRNNIVKCCIDGTTDKTVQQMTNAF